MIKIVRDGQGFTMQFSAPGTGMRSYRVHAANVDEVTLSIRHHFGDDAHHGTHDGCPLCRLMQQEARREQSRIKSRRAPDDLTDPRD